MLTGTCLCKAISIEVNGELEQLTWALSLSAVPQTVRWIFDGRQYL